MKWYRPEHGRIQLHLWSGLEAHHETLFCTAQSSFCSKGLQSLDAASLECKAEMLTLWCKQVLRWIESRRKGARPAIGRDRVGRSIGTTLRVSVGVSPLGISALFISSEASSSRVIPLHHNIFRPVQAVYLAWNPSIQTSVPSTFATKPIDSTLMRIARRIIAVRTNFHHSLSLLVSYWHDLDSTSSCLSFIYLLFCSY
jgi:hypothetical protein